MSHQEAEVDEQKERIITVDICTLSVKNIHLAKFPSYMRVTKEVEEFLLEKSKKVPIKEVHCKLCHKNGEPHEVYSSHQVQENGKVTCPILRNHICELCGATGDEAHTKTHCPEYKRVDTGFQPFFRILSNGRVSRTINHK